MSQLLNLIDSNRSQSLVLFDLNGTYSQRELILNEFWRDF